MWKNSGEERSIEASISGNALNDEPNLTVNVLPAWNHAGFPSQPIMELKLRRGAQAMANLFFSQDSPGVIVLSANSWKNLSANSELASPPSSHWLDAVTVSSRGANPEYLLVDLSGQMQRLSLR